MVILIVIIIVSCTAVRPQKEQAGHKLRENEPRRQLLITVIEMAIVIIMVIEIEMVL